MQSIYGNNLSASALPLIPTHTHNSLTNSYNNFIVNSIDLMDDVTLVSGRHGYHPICRYPSIQSMY